MSIAMTQPYRYANYLATSTCRVWRKPQARAGAGGERHGAIPHWSEPGPGTDLGRHWTAATRGTSARRPQMLRQALAADAGSSGRNAQPRRQRDRPWPSPRPRAPKHTDSASGCSTVMPPTIFRSAYWRYARVSMLDGRAVWATLPRRFAWAASAADQISPGSRQAEMQRSVGRNLARQHDGGARRAWLRQMPAPPAKSDGRRHLATTDACVIAAALEDWHARHGPGSGGGKGAGSAGPGYGDVDLSSGDPAASLLALAKAEAGDVAGAQALIAATPGDCYDCVRMRGTDRGGGEAMGPGRLLVRPRRARRAIHSLRLCRLGPGAAGARQAGCRHRANSSSPTRKARTSPIRWKAGARR